MEIHCFNNITEIGTKELKYWENLETKEEKKLLNFRA